jgi:hypothetical protein
MRMHYLGWHYSYAFVDGWRIFADGAWFLGHFFSFKELSRTAFSPWRRLHEGYSRDAGAEAVAQTFVINSLMRIVGFVVRALTIVLGILTLVAYVIAGIVIAVVWAVFPVLLIALIASCLISLVTYLKP